MNNDVASHQPELAALFQVANDLITAANDPSDTQCDKLCQYKEDTEQRWKSLSEAMAKRKAKLDEALEKTREFKVVFQQETLWLNAADDQISIEWSPRGLPEKCEEEIEQHKVM